MSTDISAFAASNATVISSTQSAGVTQQRTQSIEEGSVTPKTELLQVDSKLVAQAIEVLNQMAADQKRDIQFSVDEPSGRTVIRVFDSTSQELIRQIPGDAVLILARQFGEGNLGALMDVVA